MDIDTTELIRRARAIAAYSGMENPDLAAAAGLPRGAPKAWFDASKPNSYPSVEELVLIAQVAGIPARFAERGFADLVDNDPTEIAGLRRQFNELEKSLQADRADELERELEVAAQIAELQRTTARLQGRLRP